MFANITKMAHASSEPGAIDELEMLELGACRDVLSNKCASPALKTENWQECFIISEDKSRFAMYDDYSGELLLTATRIGSDYYISQYEDFPMTFDASGDLTESKRCCGVLRLDACHKSYTLRSTSCELCDHMLHKFRCDAFSTDTIKDRQILAKVKHATRIITGTNIEARYLTAQLPALVNETERVVWCPRTMASDDATKMYQKIRSSHTSISEQNQACEKDEYHINHTSVSTYEDESKDDTENEGRDEHFQSTSISWQQGGPKANKMNMPKKFSTPTSNDAKTISSAVSNEDCIPLFTKLPVWSSEIGSLVLKFRNRRVLMASSKNFMLNDANGVLIFQLGKADSGRFNVDFQYPMSAMQAFGIALSAYGFTAKPKK